MSDLFNRRRLIVTTRAAAGGPSSPAKELPFGMLSDAGHTLVLGTTEQGKSLAGQRVLSDAQLAQVALCMADYSGRSLSEVVAARPRGMTEAVATGLAQRLLHEGFQLNPHAPGSWLWQRLVSNTSVRHDVCYMGYTTGAHWIAEGMWVKAASADLLTDKPRHHANALSVLDTSFADDGQVHLASVLQGLARNERLWRQGGRFTEFDPSW